MTERRSDSLGPSPLIHDREAEFWHFLKLRFDLADVYNILEKRLTGSRFTWRQVRNGLLFESRLDRFYLSDKGWWIDKIGCLNHLGGSALSDHNPISLCFTMNVSSPLTRGKVAFFKANPNVVKKLENLARLKAAWLDYPATRPDNSLRFLLACQRFRHCYMDIQRRPADQQ